MGEHEEEEDDKETGGGGREKRRPRGVDFEAFSGDNNTNKSVLQLHDVVKVTKGRHSAIFDRFPNLHDEKCSFSWSMWTEVERNDVTNSRSTKNNKVRTLNVVAER